MAGYYPHCRHLLIVFATLESRQDSCRAVEEDEGVESLPAFFREARELSGRKITGKPWENHGKTMGKPWKIIKYVSKYRENPWKIMGQQYDIYEILGNHIGTCGKSKDPFSNDFKG